jgi:hypothetical protein
MTQETLKLALKALDVVKIHYTQNRHVNEAITAIKEALAQEQEPVAWMHVQGNYEEPSFRQLDDDEVERGWEQYPLYTHPPQRTWVGLTLEQYVAINSSCVTVDEAIGFTERQLKENNT